MPRNDGTYTITHTFPKCSEYMLKLPNNPNALPGFHTHLLKRWYIDKIVDTCQQGHGVQYLVCYEGYRREYDKWCPGSEMADMDALDRWEDKNGTDV